LTTLNNATIVTNGVGAITAEILNSMLQAIINSVATLDDANTFPSQQTFTVNPQFSSCTGLVTGNGSSGPVSCDQGTPTISSGACGSGTNGSVLGGSTQYSGRITIGSASTTSCIVTWASQLANTPAACIFFPMNATAAAVNTTQAYAGTPTNQSIVLNGAALANANYSYICI
jgi:hypothetical protein